MMLAVRRSARYVRTTATYQIELGMASGRVTVCWYPGWDTGRHAGRGPHFAVAFLSVTPLVADPFSARVCTGGCLCSHRYGVLGMDSSHLFLLARAAARADPPATAPHLLSELLSAHTCGGMRRIVMSTTCFDHECFGISGTGSTSLSDICSDFGRDELSSYIDVLDDDGHEALPKDVMVGARLLRFDRGERSLVHVLDRDDAVVVTSDEDAIDLIRQLVEDGVVGTYPIPSLSLIRSMYDCGALVSTEVELVCGQATEGVDLLPGMSADKINRKIRQAEELLNHVALTEARRSQYSTETR
jgi:hypothetical protein